MKGLKKRLFVSMLAMFMALSFLSESASAQPAPTPRWSYVRMIAGDMKADNKNIVKISVVVDSSTFDVDRIVAKCELQQLDDHWKTIKTWEEEENYSAIMYTKDWAVAKNYSYRLKVTAYVYQSGRLLESATSYFDYGYYN